MEEWADRQRKFEDGTFVIWPPDPVREVVNRLRERLDLPHTDDFVPHMSINDGRPDAARTQEIFEILRTSVSSGSFECGEIAFIVPDSGFHFEVVRTLPLAL